jgi:hypothetical protein
MSVQARDRSAPALGAFKHHAMKTHGTGGKAPCSERRLLLTANVSSSPIFVTLMKEALRSSETSVLSRATRRNIPEDDILHSHRRENLKSYIALTGWTPLAET